MEAIFDDLAHLSKKERQVLEDKLRAHPNSDDRRSALAFMSDYSDRDVYRAVFQPDSLTDWPVSWPGRQKLIQELQQEELPLKILVRYNCFAIVELVNILMNFCVLYPISTSEVPIVQ